jgi:hypothetical protein
MVGCLGCLSSLTLIIKFFTIVGDRCSISSSSCKFLGWTTEYYIKCPKYRLLNCFRFALGISIPRWNSTRSCFFLPVGSWLTEVKFCLLRASHCKTVTLKKKEGWSIQIFLDHNIFNNNARVIII